MNKQPPPQWLVDRAALVNSGEAVRVTVRELLSQFGLTRRSSSAIIQIRRALRSLGLTTSPKFYAVNLESVVQIVVRPADSGAADDNSEDVRQPIITFGMLRIVEEQRILRDMSRLRAGHNGYPKWIVSPQDNIESVAILLAEENVDFVPVGTSEDAIMGVIAWDDVATQDLLKRDRTQVRCGKICRPPVFVRESESVYDRKYEITKHGCVFVKDDAGRCFAVVRSGDLAAELLRLTESFLLLQEIENLVRMIISMAQPSASEINDSAHEDRRGSGLTIDQLTFSEYKSLMLHPAIRSRLVQGFGLGEQLVRQIANEHIEHTRIIRNKVLHFHPDENNEQAKAVLSNTRDFLRRIAELMDGG